MLDQSFSAKNFYDILIYENRKGKNLEKEFFKREIFDKYSLKLKEINIKLRMKVSAFLKEDSKVRNYKVTEELYKRYKKYLWTVKRRIKSEKEEKLLELLGDISANVQKDNFKIELQPINYQGKTVYVVNETPEIYFVMKQLQYSFRRLYRVKQSNRFEIVNQLKCLLDDEFPKYIIRTDLKGFYESIPNDKILQKLNEDNLLSPRSKKFIKQIIREYESKAGVKRGTGIPRGIGISAYLAEYYMRYVDKEIKELEYVTYYARYVDDIIIIFTPKYEDESIRYFQKIESIITKQTGLSIHKKEPKTKEYNLLKKENKNYDDLEFLGYRYEFQNNSKKAKIEEVKIHLTEKRIKRYKEKIKLSFEAYNFDKKNDCNSAYRYLRNRIKFLTGNTRLINNKNNILVGAFFSNLLLTETDSLKGLDSYLKWYIARNVKKSKHKDKLMQYSFFRGFEEKIYYSFTSHQLQHITQIWKSI